jgi:hypothetical protein
VKGCQSFLLYTKDYCKGLTIFSFQLATESYSGLMGLAEISTNLVRRGVAVSGHRRGTFALSATVAVALLAILISSRLAAQTNANPATTRSVNRYLFIVEASRAMQPRANGVFDALKRALDSSLNGAIHQGDLVGIWTFNEVVYQESFPTQIWSQPTQLAFAVRLRMFADPELYQRRARLDKVVPEMLKVIANTDNVTVILISTGEGVMHGTPFDEQINSSWKEWHDELDGIQMPLQTVLGAANGKLTAWIMTPGPRSIDLAKLEAVSKSGGQKENNPTGVILESGLVTNQPASMGTEQQVAFSVWALGQTSLMASATSPEKISTSQPKINASAPPAVDSPMNMPNSHALSTATPQLESSIVESAAVPAREQTNKSVVPPSTERQEPPLVSNDKTVTSTSNIPPADNGKPVEVVFVTNTPTAAPLTESTVKESTPATPTPASTPPSVASSIANAAANNHLSLLAHARASDPSPEEKQSADVALATPPRGFLRDNIKPLLLMIVAGFGAVYCFRMWLRTNARARGVSVSLAQETEDDSSQSESAERVFVRRR